jgi:hypothetical protein
MALSCVLPAVLGTLCGQPTASPAAAEIELTFTVFAPRAIRGIGYFSESGGATFERLKFYNSYRSPVMKYRGDPVLRFYREADVVAEREAAGGSSAGMPPSVAQSRPIAQCTIPKGIKKAFVLFIPRMGSAGEKQFDLFVMDEGEDSIPREHFAIINASGLELLARINGKDTKINAGVSAPIRAEKGLVILAAVRQEPEYHALMINDTWALGPGQRNLLIFFPPRTPTALLPDVVRLTEEMAQPSPHAGR